ncbi:MAG: bifunctional DNA-formamidopyrimidine glycosylase/DNA-(apurinic or apyrimidinic site) lyase [Sphingomonadales bacterium]
MPELPEVETVRRGLEPVVTGRTISAVELRRPDLRIPFPPGFCSGLVGRRMDRVGRRGKYLLVVCGDGTVLVIHLGMSGRFTIVPNDAPGPEPGPHDHVVLHIGDGGRLIYTDPRRFGLMTLAPLPELETHRFFKDLGPEPLNAGFTGASLSRALDRRRSSIKSALLDQRVVAGLGNIYVCEALHRAGLSPRRQAHTVTGPCAERLVGCVRGVLAQAIAAGGSSLKDYARVDGQLGYFQYAFAAYDRAGEVCPREDCGGKIHRILQHGRSTFMCDSCQR